MRVSLRVRFEPWEMDDIVKGVSNSCVLEREQMPEELSHWFPTEYSMSPATALVDTLRFEATVPAGRLVEDGLSPRELVGLRLVLASSSVAWHELPKDTVAPRVQAIEQIEKASALVEHAMKMLARRT